MSIAFAAIGGTLGHSHWQIGDLVMELVRSAALQINDSTKRIS
jgi:hypothetical protein